MWYAPDEGARDLEVHYLLFWCVLYKSGVYVLKVRRLTPGDLHAVERLRLERFGLTGLQESAEGIVGRRRRG